MKNLSLLVFSMVLAAIAVSCTPENASGNIPAGIDIEVGENNTLFIMNQGAWPAGSSLDVKNLSTGAFKADWFASANPGLEQGLGNTGNDMAVVGGKLWALMNGSNLIAIIDPSTGKLERFLEVDSPRFIIKKSNYAYITSYGAAINGSVYGVNGKVYRIDQSTYKMDQLEVGFQPEGLTVLGDKLYVANSGGYQAEQENRISVIDIKSFTVTGTLELPVKNLNRLFSGGGKLWVSTYDCYTPDWSTITVPASLGSVTPEGEYKAISGVKPGMLTMVKDRIFNVDNSGVAIVSTKDGSVFNLTLMNQYGEPFTFSSPYGIAVNSSSGDLYVADANFTGDSKVLCFASDGSFKWSQTTGVGTGPMLVY